MLIRYFFYIAKQWPPIWLLFVNSFWFSILIAKPEAVSNSRSDSIILKIQLIKNFLHNWINFSTEQILFNTFERFKSCQCFPGVLILYSET